MARLLGHHPSVSYLKLNIIRSAIDDLHPEYGASRVSMVVSDNVDIDPCIFVFQRYVSGESTGYSGEFFYSVASLSDLANLPDEASDSPDEPFYRSATLTLDFASNAEADEAVVKLKEEVALLVEASNIMLDQDRWETEIVEFGILGESGPS